MKKLTKVKQVAALPLRTKRGVTQVMLITSRDTGRWVIPKGWPEKDLSDAETAALEAWEEAGLRGEISAKPVGSFEYIKLHPKLNRLAKVFVYLLQVTETADDWPEQEQRERRWFTPEDAALKVNERGLAKLIRRRAA